MLGGVRGNAAMLLLGLAGLALLVVGHWLDLPDGAVVPWLAVLVACTSWVALRDPVRRGFAIPLGLGSVLLVLYSVHYLFGVYASAEPELIALVLGGATVTALAGAVRSTQRAGWLLLGLAMLGFALSRVWDAAEPAVASQFPAIADYGFFVFYPVAGAAMLLILRQRLPGMTLRLLLDASIAGIALAVFVAFVLFPSHDLNSVSSLLSSEYLYAVGDLLLVGVLLAGCILTNWTPGPALVLLAAGAGLLSLADTSYVVDLIHHRGAPDAITSLGGVAAMIVLSWASWQRPKPTIETRSSTSGTIIPAVSGFLMLPVLVAESISGSRLEVLTLIGATIVTFLVGVRLLFTLVENERLIAVTRREASRIAAVLESAAEGIVETSIDGCVVFANPAACAMLELDGGDPLGRPWTEVGGCDATHVEMLRNTISSGTSHSLHDDRLMTRNGREFPADCSIAPIRDGTTNAGAVVSFRDITARRGAEAELRQSRRHLAEAQLAAGMGSWEFDSSTGGVFWSGAIARLHNLPEETPPSVAAIMLSMSAPEAAGLMSRRERCMLTGESFEFGYTARENRIGAGRAIHVHCSRTENADGSVKGLLGTCQDITDRVRR